VRIGDALSGVKSLYIETTPLIYYVEENPAYIDRMEIIIGRVEDTSLRAVCSVITLTEVLIHPIQMGRGDLETAYRNILISGSAIHLFWVDVAIAERAAHLRSQYGLRTPDALHVATAIIAGCDAFLTNDKRLARITEILVLVLDKLETDEGQTSP
jgi:predicted nucleic acid-binding protein